MGKLIRSSNLSKLKEAWENQASGGGSGFRFWKPKDFGRYTIRFLPPTDENHLFFKQTAQYKIGENYLFAPYIEKRSDPIYDYYRALYNKGTDEAIALAKEIKPRKQYLYNIIVKDELGQASENPTKVYVYMSGKILYDTVMDYFFDDDYGDLTDVEEGFDFVLVKEQGDLGFPNYKKSRPKPKSSPLFDDEEMVEEVLSNLHNLDDEIEYKSVSELKEILEQFLDTRNNTQEMVEESVEESSKPAKKSKPKPKVEENDDDDDEELDDFEKQLMAEIESDD